MPLGNSKHTRMPERLGPAGARILVAGLVLRALWAAAVPMSPVSDSHAYDVFAQNIASGMGHAWASGELTAFWAVGTSAVYAAVYWCFGHSYLAATALNILVSLAVIWLTMDLARHWWSRRVGLTAGAVMALWPLQIQFTTVLASEVLFQCALLSALWLGTRSEWHWLPRAIAVGAAAGATCYIRPIALLLPGLLVLGMLLWRPNTRPVLPALRFGAVCAVVMLAVLIPWSIRNQHVLGEFVLVSSNGGSNLWFGNHPGTQGTFTSEVPEHVRELGEVERDRVLKQEALAYIRSAPAAFLQRSAKKALMLHDRETIGVAWNSEGLTRKFGERVLGPLKVLSTAYWLAALALALGGAVMLIVDQGYRGLFSPPLLIWAYFSALHATTVVADRYHMPSNPLIAMLAASALAGAWRRLAGKSMRLGSPSPKGHS